MAVAVAVISLPVLRKLLAVGAPLALMGAIILRILILIVVLRGLVRDIDAAVVPRVVRTIVVVD